MCTVNRLEGLSLPRKSVVRLTNRPDMTLDVYRGRKTTMQHGTMSCYMGNYQYMSEDLRETDWNKIKNNDIDIYSNNLTEHITNLANIHIPNKIIKIRKSDPSWLSNHIKRLIRKRKDYMKNLRKQARRQTLIITNI